MRQRAEQPTRLPLRQRTRRPIRRRPPAAFVMAAFLCVTCTTVTARAHGSARINGNDYVPELRFRAGQESYPLHLTELGLRGGRGNGVESNWNLYRPGSWGGDQPLGVSLHVTPGRDPRFACDENPEGRFQVYRYVFYFARSEGPVSYEHDWAWLAVLVLHHPAGEAPYAAWIGEAEEEAEEGAGADPCSGGSPTGAALRYFPGFDRTPVLRVVDGTHPVLFLSGGNTLGFDGVEEGRIAWEDLAVGLRPEDGTLAYTSCAQGGGAALHESTLARGEPRANGLSPCARPVLPPWLCPALWDAPVLPSALRPPPASSGLGCVFRDEECCRPSCTWALRAGCTTLPAPGFGSLPVRGQRPQGVFAGYSGPRLIWSRWAGGLQSYRVLVERGSSRDTLALQADSTLRLDEPSVEPRNSQGDPVPPRYRVLGYRDGVEVRVSPPASAAFFGVAQKDPAHSLSLLRLLPGRGDAKPAEILMAAASVDGWLFFYAVSASGEPRELAAYDLREWDLWGPGTCRTAEIDAAWVTVAPAGRRLLLALALPDLGIALFDATEPRRLLFQGLTPGAGLDLAWTQEGLFWAAGAQGLVFCRVVNGGGDAFTGPPGESSETEAHGTRRSPSLEPMAGYRPEDLPGAEAEAVGALDAHVVGAAFSTRRGGRAQSGLYGVRARDGSIPLLEEQWRLPGDLGLSGSEGPFVWHLDDVDSAQRLAILHDCAGSGLFAVLDLRSGAPRVRHGERNGLFRQTWASDLGRGRLSVLLPGERSLRAGSVPVGYQGAAPVVNPDQGPVRAWGGLELYAERSHVSGRRVDGGPSGFPPGFRFVYQSAIAEDGFSRPSQPDLVPTALTSWSRGGATYVCVAWRDPVGDDPRGRRLIVYRLLGDSPSSSGDPETAALPSTPDGAGGRGSLERDPFPSQGASVVTAIQALSAGGKSANGVRLTLVLARDAPVRVEVIGATGRLVRHLAASSFARGTHELTWDGRDDAERPVPSGVYFLLVRAGRERVQRRLLLLH